MKIFSTILVIILGTVTITSKAQNNVKIKSNTFIVHGHCGMCKTRIDSAAKSTPGVIAASWNIETKIINVVYNINKTKTDSIHSKISNTGYRTEKLVADSIGYSKLPECCKVKDAFVDPKIQNK